MKINSVHELATEIGTHNKDIDSVSKAIYQGTDCGAWVARTSKGIQIGSIVEGVDQCAEVHDLAFPFTIDQFWAAVQAVEDEAKQIWQDTHGCDDCGPEDEETGYRAINPECKTCHGEGTIL